MASSEDDLNYPSLEADPLREYTPEEEKLLAYNLLQITEDVHSSAFIHCQADVNLLRLFHENLFRSVRRHAGHTRHEGFGAEYLVFGPNRSDHRSDVPKKLEDLFSDIRRSIDSFDKNRNAEDYEYSAIHVAVWAHATVIRIHPFEDGNGRTSRLLMNWILIRLGLKPIAIEAVKMEYNECLNHFFIRNDINLLCDLCLRLYPLT